MQKLKKKNQDEVLSVIDIEIIHWKGFHKLFSIREFILI